LFFILTVCRQNNFPYFILGNGSNLLVRDKGIRGVVVSLLGLTKMHQVSGETANGEILVQAGVSMKALAEFAAASNIGGFEFIHGIPGSVGGGIFMNAGAYDSEMKDVFKTARCIDENNTFVSIGLTEMDFSYRKSFAQTNGLVVVSAILRGSVGTDAICDDDGSNCVGSAIMAKMADLEHQRNSKQPLDKPSAGSVFKRPPGKFAGKLIADAGLRGRSIGGAQVSEKHCGFIINKGSATAKDVLELVNLIQHTVNEKFDVWLETEIKIVGE
jgi:UDP-N-acetylmuramate dehydrogenase